MLAEAARDSRHKILGLKRLWLFPISLLQLSDCFVENVARSQIGPEDGVGGGYSHLPNGDCIGANCNMVSRDSALRRT